MMAEKKYTEIPRLEDYCASPTFGFVEKSPSTDLPEYFQPWVALAKQTEELIDSGEMRNTIHQLPLLDHTCLGEPHEWKAALMFLTALTSAYVWCEGEDDIPEVLPQCLAIPFAGIAKHLQITPSLTSFGFGLVNWKLKDPQGKVELDNMETIVQICGGSDESWFFCTATQVELDFAPALCSILEAQKAVIDRDVNVMIKELRTIEKAVHKMKHSLSRMTDGCDPHVFYNVFRPFLAGWDAPAFKKKKLRGLIYEGVSNEPLQYTGGSAAQSSTLPCLDAALGIAHGESEEKLCRSFQDYMPKPHRELIRAIDSGPSIKTFVHECGSAEVVQSFNQCLLAIKAFRDTHLQIVTRYIIARSQKRDVNKRFLTQDAAGTGGTGFMKFLKALRDSTIFTMLGRDLNESMTDGATNLVHGSGHQTNQYDGDWKDWKRCIVTLTICTVVAVLTVLVI